MNQPDDRPATPEVAGLSYRCVCGCEFAIAADASGVCPRCQRRFSAEVLDTDFGNTVTVLLDEANQPDAASRASDDEHGEIGRSFGHYRTVRQLGQGGMGTVYQALDESLQRYVALKVIRPSEGHAASDTHAIERLQQEAIAQARVNHPNVVHIYYVGREGRSPFFAMEMTPGLTVADQVAIGPLPFERVIELSIQIVDALRHCAKFDIVHGDIKPSNLLLADDGVVKLSDFGLSRRMSESADSPAVLAGSPNYLAPEIGAGAELDIRSDMYSLGVTLFEMTFGRLPYSFAGKNLLQRIQVHRAAEVDFPEEWPESVPMAWRVVLQRLLAKSPEDRFGSYDELLDDLRQLRPVSLPKAGRVQRGLAWMVDLGLAHAAQQLFYGVLVAAGPAAVSRFHPLAYLVIATAGGLVPLGAAVLQMRWKTTPGKRLFQLRIVDQHGVTPHDSVLAARSVAQLLPIATATVYQLLSALHMGALGFLVTLVAGVALLADMGFAFFRRDGRSLHDTLFRTRVVLDVRGAGQGTRLETVGTRQY